MTFQQLMIKQDAFIEHHISAGADEIIKDAAGIVVEVRYRSPLSKMRELMDQEHSARVAQFMNEVQTHEAVSHDRDFYTRAAAAKDIK